MKKICIVIAYFKKWPGWFDFFMKSCEFNSSIDWLLLTDCKIPRNSPKNMRFIKFSLNDFSRLASKKLGFKINIKNAYKICDLRPAFGVILDDFLKNYDFWGHSDIDLIYGNIKKFITEDMLSKYDIITPLGGRIAGHFTLYKNNTGLNNLYKKVGNYKSLFQVRKHKGFDESAFYKIVGQLKQKNELKCYFKTLVKQGHYADKRFILKFDNGKVFDIEGAKEYLYFHILNLKKGFTSPKFKESKNMFYISKYEIFYKTEMPLFKKSLIDLKRKLSQHAAKVRNIENKIEEMIGNVGIYLKRNNPGLYYKLKRDKNAT